MANQNQWEDVHADPVAQGSGTERLKIEQGWLYRTTIIGEKGEIAVALCFVPATHHGEPRVRNPMS